MSALGERQEDKLLTAKEAAEFFQVSVDLVRRWAAKDQIPCVRLGHRTLRFRRSALEEFAARKERGR